jgi:4-hydroxy-3-methylbut-2-en-1-yl diphosphate reductase
MNIEIDPDAGFCFGVTRVVNKAEEIIEEQGTLYCLGEIVHNQKEIERLEGLGLKTISYEEYLTLSNCRVLIRAHGEPPETYQYAARNNIEIIDGTCPIVLRLQSRIKDDFDENQEHAIQIVIFGKIDHAEVRGLAGQTDHKAVIVESIDDIRKIDFTHPVHLYAQTTMSADKYQQLQEEIIHRAGANGAIPAPIQCTNSICRQVSERIPKLKTFCMKHGLILFVSYKQSSNGKLLYSQCKSVNGNSQFVTDLSDLEPVWFENISSIGITGATSTPRWLLEEFASYIQKKY